MHHSATRQRAEHWAAFLASMGTRHGTIERAEPAQDQRAALERRGDRGEPPPRAVIDRFADHLLRHVPQRPTAPAWWRPQALRHGNDRCAYCARALPATAVVCLDHLIPPSVGGPHHVDAVVPCCVSCRRAKGGRDLLMWRREPIGDLHAMRLRLAQDAHNHVDRTEEDRLRRWRHPRFACRVMAANGGVLVGWRRMTDAPIGAYICLGIDHEAAACRPSRFDGTGPVIYWAPNTNKEFPVLRDLIEQNAWVRPIGAADFGALPAWAFAAPGGIRALPGATRRLR